jgi:transposase-like protein
MAAVVPSYKGFRYLTEIISHCVWLYYRFPLSFREVEEMTLERGVVSHTRRSGRALLHYASSSPDLVHLLALKPRNRPRCPVYSDL